MWTQLFALLGAILIVWILFRVVRNNPETFTRENFSKSLSTMGFLALILVGFIAVCVMLLRMS
jgi:ABC-type xylose transport system permease subunit